MIKKAHDEGKQVSIHTNGETAIDQVLNIYKTLLEPGDDSRHCIEHASFITEDQLKVCGELGVLPSLFVYQNIRLDRKEPIDGVPCLQQSST